MCTMAWATFVLAFVGGLTSFTYSPALTTKSAILTVACAMGVKHFMVIMIVMRCKIASVAFATKEEGGNVVFAVFKPLLMAYNWAPLATLADAERMGRCVNNNTENEPLFIGLALAVGAVVGESAVITVVCLVFMYARILHSIFFLLLPYTGPEPRTFAFDFAFFPIIILAVYGLVSTPAALPAPAAP
uniref:Glutathione transferase n=2 Tax=Prymnesium polylepis TaxID=72548 RepID=A0A7S4J8J4_9EUKA|mmetsp:Transcript_40741/g.101317  ORF Transcript_40741/g.101317 Transcript_40741/m.101317 type:complete len:188 (+) Transcript_40741:56-619(+)